MRFRFFRQLAARLRAPLRPPVTVRAAPAEVQPRSLPGTAAIYDALTGSPYGPADSESKP